MIAKHNLIEVEGMEGISFCSICNGAEGSLPTDCPGHRLSNDEADQILDGQLDYIDGRWVEKDNGSEA